MLPFEAMVRLGLVEQAELVDRFRLAADALLLDARCEDLPVYVQRLHQVERDMLGEEPTHIDLPPWIEG